MKRIFVLAALAFLVSYHANAQHEHHNMQDTGKMQKSDTMKMNNMNMESLNMNNQ